MADLFVSKEIALQFLLKRAVNSTNPLQQHGGVLFFLVAIVCQFSLQLLVLTDIYSLSVPAKRFQLLSQRNQSAVHAFCFLSELLYRFVPL